MLLEFERYAVGYIFQLELTIVVLQSISCWYQMVRCITSKVLHMRQFCRFFQCLAFFETVEFKCLPCSNNELYDDAVFADRFRYQLIVFGIRVWIGYLESFVLKIAYEMDTAKIIADFCLISYCLYDFIRLNSIVCHVQTTRCTMMWFSMIDSDIN